MQGGEMEANYGLMATQADSHQKLGNFFVLDCPAGPEMEMTINPLYHMRCSVWYRLYLTPHGDIQSHPSDHL